MGIAGIGCGGCARRSTRAAVVVVRVAVSGSDHEPPPQQASAVQRLHGRFGLLGSGVLAKGVALAVAQVQPLDRPVGHAHFLQVGFDDPRVESSNVDCANGGGLLLLLLGLFFFVGQLALFADETPSPLGRGFVVAVAYYHLVVVVFVGEGGFTHWNVLAVHLLKS